MKTRIHQQQLFLLFYSILGLCVLGWFRDHGFILGGDLSWPPFFSRFLGFTTSIWDDSVNAGFMVTRQLATLYPYALVGRLLELMIHPGPAIQLLIYYISFVFCGIGMYLFSKEAGLKPLGAFIAGVVYMVGPYAAIVPWNPSYGITFPFYAYLPLALYFECKLLSITYSGRKEWPCIIAYSTATMLTFMAASYSNPAFFLLFLFFTFCLFIYYFVTFQERLVVFRRYIVFLAFYIFLNVFWLLPFIMNIGSEYSNASNAPAGLINDVETLKLNSVHMSDAFRATGFWALHGETSGNYYYDWHADVFTWWYIIVTWSLPLMALFPLFWKRHCRKKNMLWSMGALLAFGILINTGMKMDGPWHQVAEVFFYSDFLSRAYRAIYLKLGTLIALPLSYLVGTFFDDLEERIRRESLFYIVSGGFVIVFLCTVGRPFLNGRIILSQGTLLPAHHVRIPQEYYNFKTLDSRLASEGRYFTLPIPQSYNLNLDWGYGGFSGADFLRYFTKSSLIYANDDSVLLKRIIYDINNGDSDYGRWLRLLNVKFLFIHKDLNTKIGTYLTKRMIIPIDAHAVLSNRYFDVYALPQSNYLPHIYTPSKQIIVSSWSDMTKKEIDVTSAQAIYTKDQNKDKVKALDAVRGAITIPPSIEYRKISPIAYQIVVHSASSAIPLVFLENYHSGWKIFTRPLSLDDQFYLRSRSSLFLPPKDQQDSQASKSELNEYIQKGWISTLGESGITNFVSRSSYGSIQNNNLHNSPWYASWIQRPVVSEDQHFVVNSYANAWTLPIKSICNHTPSACHINDDGTRDVALLIAFTPQRIFLLGSGISLLFLMIGGSCIIFLGFRRARLLEWMRNRGFLGGTQGAWITILGLWMLFFRLPFFSTPLNFDEDQYVYFAWQLLGGKGFFSTDWDNKPPLIHILYIMNSVLFGGLTVFTIRLFGLMYGAITVVAFYWLARYFFQRRFWAWFSTFLFATLFFHPAIEGQYSNTENFFVLWIILAFLIMFRRPEKAWQSYLCMGLAFILKPTTVLTVIPLSIYHYFSLPQDIGRMRRLGKVFKGMMVVGVPLELFLIYFFFRGTLSDAIQWTFLNNIIHTAVGRQSALLLLLQTVREITLSTVLFWILALFGIVGTVVNPLRKRIVIVGWSITAAISVAIGGWYFPHYFLELAAPIVLLMTYTFLRWYQYCQRHGERWDIIARSTTTVTILAVVILAVLPVLRDWNVYRQYLQGSNRERLIPKTEQAYQQAGAYLRKVHGSHDTLFVWDGWPALYVLSGIHPSIQDIWKYPFLNEELQYPTLRGWFTHYAASRARLERYMRESPPSYVAITVDYQTIGQEYELNRLFFDTVFRDYKLENVFGDIWIYHRDINSVHKSLQAYVEKKSVDDIVSEFKPGPGGGIDHVFIINGVSKIIKNVKVSLRTSSWVFPFQGVERPLVLRGLGDLWYINFQPPAGTALDRYTVNMTFVDGTSFTTKLHEYQYDDAMPSNPQTWQIEFPKDTRVDVVSLGDIKPSGASDVVMHIKHLDVPFNNVEIIINDHRWHGPMNGIDSPIVFNQNPDSAELLFAPRDFRGGEHGVLKIFFVDGTVHQKSFLLPRSAVWIKK